MKLPAHFTAARDEYLAAKKAVDEIQARFVELCRANQADDDQLRTAANEDVWNRIWHKQCELAKETGFDEAARHAWKTCQKLVAATRSLPDGLTIDMALSFRPKRSRR